MSRGNQNRRGRTRLSLASIAALGLTSVAFVPAAVAQEVDTAELVDSSVEPAPRVNSYVDGGITATVWISDDGGFDDDIVPGVQAVLEGGETLGPAPMEAVPNEDGPEGALQYEYTLAGGPDDVAPEQYGDWSIELVTLPEGPPLNDSDGDPIDGDNPYQLEVVELFAAHQLTDYSVTPAERLNLAEDTELTAEVTITSNAEVATPQIQAVPEEGSDAEPLGPVDMDVVSSEDGTHEYTFTLDIDADDASEDVYGEWTVQLVTDEDLVDEANEDIASPVTLGTVDVYAAEVVTPAAPTFSDDDGTYTIPEVAGVQYLLDDEVVEAGTHAGEGTVTITAEPLEGYEFADDATTEWTHEFATEPEEPEEPEQPDNRTGQFHLSNSWSGTTDVVLAYGKYADEVFIGDWNGDGRDTIAVRKGNAFHVANSFRGGDADAVITYGRPGDDILVGDWNGDGRDTFAVRRGAEYHVKNSLRGGDADVVFTYGRDGDEVLVGDWNGDSADTFTVRRGQVFHVKNSLRGGDADVAFAYGREGDVVLAGDWDGDGADSFTIQRGRVYHVNNSLRGGDADIVLMFGRDGDQVYVGDWDGDGIDTLGIRRPL